ncbi:hypothetical protein [Streptomyces cinereoruber]|uniref:hypothetical protein n=1 Tax=Streptomyces cinereoruber TaxID=67260 RepID=UPI003639338B
MTTHGDEPGPADPTDRELTRHHEAFTAKIEAALDVEAGLRDILFPSRHEVFTVKVETALDVEVGLRDILMPPTVQAPPSISPAVAPPAAKAALSGNRWRASAAQRLKLRSNPRVAAASRVLRVVGNWADTSPLGPVRDADREFARARAHFAGLDRALARVRNAIDYGLTYEIGRIRHLAHLLQRTFALASAPDPDSIRGLALTLDRAYADARALAGIRASDLALALDRDPDPARVRDLEFARALARALGLARDSAREFARHLALACDTDCDLARDLVRDLVRALDCDLALTRHRCLLIINGEYTQAVGAPVSVDEDSLASLMDDFTTDDLSNADVHEDDNKLTGVRWSDSTTWPASTDIYRLKRRSDRQEDGSWIIRAGTGNVRENLLT